MPPPPEAQNVMHAMSGRFYLRPLMFVLAAAWSLPVASRAETATPANPPPTPALAAPALAAPAMAAPAAPAVTPVADFSVRATLPAPVEAEPGEAPAAALPAVPTKSIVTDEDTLIHGARECTRHMPEQEQKYAIPQHLLMAIGSNESGRYHEGLKAVVPWPWTINAAGKGFYFASKAEAIAAVRSFQAKGIQSIDVGCMQVNLKHHPQAFTSLQNAFDPEANVAYAAKFLRTNYETAGSWLKAVAYYHSQTPKYGTPYAQAIYKRWAMVLARGRSTPAEAMAAAGAAATTQEIASLQADMLMPKAATRTAPRRPTLAVSRDRAASQRADAIRSGAPKMKIIRVYKDGADSPTGGLELASAAPPPRLTAIHREHGVTLAHGTPPTALSEEADLAQIRAVSRMIIQDIADAQSAYGRPVGEAAASRPPPTPPTATGPAPAVRTPPASGIERGVAVTRGTSPTRGQFAPKKTTPLLAAQDNVGQNRKGQNDRGAVPALPDGADSFVIQR